MEQKVLKNELLALADKKYRKFSSALIPGTDTMLGVRLPELRKIGKRIAKADWRTYLKRARDDSFEETLLQGMVIGYADMELAERLTLIEAYIPKIDNWSSCDSFCTGLKFAKKHKKEVWLFLQPYLHSNEVYEIRFGVVMFITYFVEDLYLEPMFRNFNAIDCDNYYVKMAVAWAITSCFTVFPEMTMIYLKANNLDDFTYNKALQKITESRQVKPDTKVRIRCMKRKTEVNKKNNRGGECKIALANVNPEAYNKKSVVYRKENHLCVYSYRNASMGSSLAALLAG